MPKWVLQGRIDGTEHTVPGGRKGELIKGKVLMKPFWSRGPPHTQFR